MFGRYKYLKREHFALSNLAGIFKRRLNLLVNTFLYYLPWGFYKENRRKIKLLRNKHSGERCFIIANGPSLNTTNLSLLKNEHTIGMNKIYMMEKMNGFVPEYLACIDYDSQIKYVHDEFDELTYPCFFSFGSQKLFSRKSNQYFLRIIPFVKFSKDLSRFSGNGASVTFTCIQLAYYLGFSEVYLIGKDHSFVVQRGKKRQKTTEHGDINHFCKDYYKEGHTWSLPNYGVEEMAYRLSRKIFEKSGRILKNATIGGNLTVLERVDYYSLFDSQPKK